MLFLSAVFWLQSASFKISVCHVYTQLYMIPVKVEKSAGIDAINMTRSISVTALILCFFYFVPGQSERVQRAAGAAHGMKCTTAQIMNRKKKKKDCVTFRCLCSFTFFV